MRWNDENLLARFIWNSISCLSMSHETVRQETGGAGLEVQKRPGVRHGGPSHQCLEERFLRRKASAGQVSGVFLGSDESPMRGREGFCDVLHSVEDELLELG